MNVMISSKNDKIPSLRVIKFNLILLKTTF